MKSIFFLITVLFFKSFNTYAQTNLKIDTLRYKITGGLVDTFYYLKRELNRNTFQITYLDQNFKQSDYSDTFIIAMNQWKKIYNKNEITFLSVADFKNSKKTLEYIDREKGSRLYYEYTPIKIISIENKEFYLYMVREMSGKGMVESLGEGPFYIVFDFEVGEIYRSTYHITKVLEGFEEYIKYFKW